MKNILKIFMATCLVIFLSMSTVLANQSSKKTMEIRGSHTIAVSPDTAIIDINLMEYDEDNEIVKEALIYKGKVLKENLLKADIGIKEEHITSNNFNIYPEYNYEEGRKVIGYSGYQDYTIILEDLEKLNKVIDIITNIESSTSHYINYTLSDKEEIYNEILVSAVENANDKANKLCKSFGDGTYDIINITEVRNDYYDMPSYTKSEMSIDSALPELNPSKINISANVIVTYEY